MTLKEDALAAVIELGEASTFQISQEVKRNYFERLTGPKWWRNLRTFFYASPAAIFNALYSLEKEGKLDSHWGPPIEGGRITRRMYRKVSIINDRS